MLRTARGPLALVIGLVMVALGAWLLVATFVLGRPPVRGGPLLNVAFAAFFLLRGVMNVRSARRLARSPSAMPRAPRDESSL